MYIDDVLSINKQDLNNYWGLLYSTKLEIKDTTRSNTSTSYLNIPFKSGGTGSTSYFPLRQTCRYFDFRKK